MTLAWVQAMGGTAAQFWDAEGFSRAVKQHPQVAKVLCGNVRGLIGTHTARPPQWLTHASMKEVGLSAWLDLDPACGAELVAAGAALSFEAWRAVWVLVPDFRGTPAELVAVAATAS